MIEAKPEMTTLAKMRLASEAQGKIMFGYMKELRSQFDRTGVHAWEVMNVPERKLQ